MYGSVSKLKVQMRGWISQAVRTPNSCQTRVIQTHPWVWITADRSRPVPLNTANIIKNWVGRCFHVSDIHSYIYIYYVEHRWKYWMCIHIFSEGHLIYVKHIHVMYILCVNTYDVYACECVYIKMRVSRVFGLGDAYYKQGIVFHMSDSYNFQLSMWLKGLDTWISLRPQRFWFHTRRYRCTRNQHTYATMFSKLHPKTAPCALCRLNEVRPRA